MPGLRHSKKETALFPRAHALGSSYTVLTDSKTYSAFCSALVRERSLTRVSRKSALTKDWYDKMVEVETPLTELLKDTLGKRFEENPDRTWFMYDQIALASLIEHRCELSRWMAHFR